MTRKEINAAVKVLDFSSLLVEDKDLGALTIEREDHPEDYSCDGNAENWDEATMGEDLVGCNQAGRWMLKLPGHDVPREMFESSRFTWRCSACLLEELGAKGQLKVVAGEVTIDRSYAE